MSSQTSTLSERYQTTGVIGQGGMGLVYTAKDRLSGDIVALKKVLISVHDLVFKSKGATKNTDDANLSLAQEFRVLSSLRHPHIVSVYDYGFTAEKTPYFTMELLDSPITFTKASAKLNRVEKVQLFIQLLQAIGYLHRRGILHQDLKPNNIMVVDGQVKVLDFGLAQERTDETVYNTEKIVGTLPYLAPELFKSIPNSRETDLWAVGIMMYEIFVGQHPFNASTVLELIENVIRNDPDFSQLAQDDKLIDVIQRLLAKKPEDRFHYAYEVIEALCEAVAIPLPAESNIIRESFLQAASFVGREAELEQIITALPENTQAPSSLWLLGGESGVGKSRLADEIRSRTLVKGVMVLRGQGVEGGGQPFQIWRELIRHLLLMQDIDDLQAGILKELVPDIERLLDRPVADVPALTGQGHQDRLVLTIIDLLRDLPQPVLLLLEDLQWVDESLAVLRQLLKVLDQLPGIMIVGTYRNDERPGLPEELVGAQVIDLNRLDMTEVSQLSEAILGDAGRNSEIIQLLATETEGNTFFIVETMRALAEEAGELSQIGTRTLPQNILTGGMQQLMRRRLHKVDDRYQDIQMQAAILGREIDTALLNRIYSQTLVQTWLNDAAEAAVLTVQENMWRFAHDKLRETILADILSNAKSKFHRTAAETIEAVYPDNKAYHEALLGHWKNAQDLAKEIYYTDVVTEHMIKYQGNYADANALLVDVIQRLPADNLRGPILYYRLATTYQTRGQRTEATQYAQEAQALAIKLGDEQALASSLRILGIIANEQGSLDEAAQLFQQGLVIFEKLQDETGIALCLNNRANIYRSKGEFQDAIKLYQRGLVMAQQLDDPFMISIYLNNLGVIFEALGNYTEATDLYQQNLAIAQQSGIRDSIGLAYVNLGNIAYHLADYEQAEQRYGQSLEIFEQVGNQYVVAVLLSNMGEVTRIRGDQQRTLELIQQSLEIRQTLNDKLGVGNCLKIFGIIALEQENYAEAQDYFEQSLAIYQEIGARADETQALTYVGWTLFKQGKPDESYFAKSLKITQETGVALDKLFNIIGFAAVLYEQGQFIQAAEYIGLAKDHPNINQNALILADDLMSSLETKLASHELELALKRGGQLDLETVVGGLLSVFTA